MITWVRHCKWFFSMMIQLRAIFFRWSYHRLKSKKWSFLCVCDFSPRILLRCRFQSRSIIILLRTMKVYQFMSLCKQRMQNCDNFFGESWWRRVCIDGFLFWLFACFFFPLFNLSDIRCVTFVSRLHIYVSISFHFISCHVVHRLGIFVHYLFWFLFIFGVCAKFGILASSKTSCLQNR